MSEEEETPKAFIINPLLYSFLSTPRPPFPLPSAHEKVSPSDESKEDLRDEFEEIPLEHRKVDARNHNLISVGWVEIQSSA